VIDDAPEGCMITNEVQDVAARLARLESRLDHLERSLDDRINVRVYQESNRLLLFLMPVILTMALLTVVIAKL
jgi:hypothetical protein